MSLVAELIARASGGIVRKGFSFNGGDPVKITVIIYRNRIRRALEAKYSRIMYKLGAYTKTTMQRSMRYRKGVSAPGQPPSAHKHSGAGLRKSIEFSVDRSKRSVAIGPVLAGDSK